MEKEWNDLNKMERILVTYHQFKYGICPELLYFPAKNQKMFERDCNVLRKIGVKIKYSAKNKGYTSNLNSQSQAEDLYIPETDNKAEERFLRRLIRLIDAMNTLGEDVSDWYKMYYPDISPRTRQRDLETLRNIGYNFTYAGTWIVDVPMGFLF